LKILVLEYVTGGGMRQESIHSALAEEGGRMLRALADDLLAVAGVELIILHDDRLPAPPADARVQPVSVAAAAFPRLWRAGIAACDAVWPIAPETGGILERLCLDVEAAGKPLLNSPAATVRLATSKLATARQLAAAGVSVAETLPLPEWPTQTGRPFVIKPDDGVGCEGLRIVRDPARFCRLKQHSQSWIAQPWLEGEALSLSALFADGKARLLSLNRQLVEAEGLGLALRGCRVNAREDADGRWQALAGQVAAALPGLWGYAGIDLVLGRDGPSVLEINPRLTTSYAGLRRATGENPAALVLNLLAAGELPPPRREAGRAVDILLEKHRGD
jgi:predicted ATP-grasp superfamily ATP-dependent carboligase